MFQRAMNRLTAEQKPARLGMLAEAVGFAEDQRGARRAVAWFAGLVCATAIWQARRPSRLKPCARTSSAASRRAAHRASAIATDLNARGIAALTRSRSSRPVIEAGRLFFRA
jgi:hypothetical protein